MCHSYGLTEGEKTKGLSFTPNGEALRFYIKNSQDTVPYQDICRKLLNNHVNSEHQNCKLILWRSLKLSSTCNENPDKSELDVFTMLIDKLTSIQG